MRPTRRFFVLAAVVLAGLFVAEAFALVSVGNENDEAADLAQSPEASDEPTLDTSPSPTVAGTEESDDEDEDSDKVASTETGTSGSGDAEDSDSLLPRTGKRLLDLTALATLLMMCGLLLTVAPPIEVYSFSLEDR